MALDDSHPVPRHPLPKRPVVDPTTTVSGLMPHVQSNAERKSCPARALLEWTGVSGQKLLNER